MRWLFPLAIALWIVPLNAEALPAKHSPNVDHDLLKQRLEQLDFCVSKVYHPAILRQVERYTLSGRRSTEHLLGKKERFFPIFEHYLQQYGLPEELKYLAVW